ncbi:MAG: hypothetical protein FD149_2768, partial [Rhodospirillaceae bacterium]
ELYGLESRSTVNRLLRKYLEEVILTPTELLHNNRELKRLLDLDIAQSAVDRVATLQAKQNSSDSRERRDVLYGFVEQAWLRLRQLGDRPDVPRVREIGFAAAVERIDATAAPEERDFLALVALSNELVNLRNWSAKMQTLIDQMDKAGASRAVGLIDRVIADICGARGIIPELVGTTTANLGTFILTLVDFSNGRLPGAGRMDDDPALALNRRLAASQIADTRSVLVDYAVRQMRSAQPLSRNEPGAEYDVFQRLANRLITPAEMFGGSATAEALSQRALRFLPQGGAPGRREAVRTVTGLLQTPIQKTRFLLALANTDLGREQMDVITTQMNDFLGRANSMEDLVTPRTAPKARMQEVTTLYTLLRQTEGVAEETRFRLADHMDGLLTQFLIDNQIIEKLDRTEDSLRLRAVRLVQFCASGVLTDGQAFELARERVLTHLRQPRFEETFIADLADPAAKEKALRDFHALLKTSNFFRER